MTFDCGIAVFVDANVLVYHFMPEPVLGTASGTSWNVERFGVRNWPASLPPTSQYLSALGGRFTPAAAQAASAVTGKSSQPITFDLLGRSPSNLLLKLTNRLHSRSAGLICPSISGISALISGCSAKTCSKSFSARPSAALAFVALMKLSAAFA